MNKLPQEGDFATVQKAIRKTTTKYVPPKADKIPHTIKFKPYKGATGDGYTRTHVPFKSYVEPTPTHYDGDQSDRHIRAFANWKPFDDSVAKTTSYGFPMQEFNPERDYSTPDYLEKTVKNMTAEDMERRFDFEQYRAHRAAMGGGAPAAAPIGGDAPEVDMSGADDVHDDAPPNVRKPPVKGKIIIGKIPGYQGRAQRHAARDEAHIGSKKPFSRRGTTYKPRASAPAPAATTPPPASPAPAPATPPASPSSNQTTPAKPRQTMYTHHGDHRHTSKSGRTNLDMINPTHEDYEPADLPHKNDKHADDDDDDDDDEREEGEMEDDDEAEAEVLDNTTSQAKLDALIDERLTTADNGAPKAIDVEYKTTGVTSADLKRIRKASEKLFGQPGYYRFIHERYGELTQQFHNDAVKRRLHERMLQTWVAYQEVEKAEEKAEEEKAERAKQKPVRVRNRQINVGIPEGTVIGRAPRQADVAAQRRRTSGVEETKTDDHGNVQHGNVHDDR